MLKKNLIVVLETSYGTLYKLPVYSDVRYSQAYKEEEISYLTLHNPKNKIKGGFISSIDEGKFDFTVPALNSENTKELLQLFFSLDPFTLHFRENNIQITLFKCIVSSLVFNFNKGEVITVSVSGEYSFSDKGLSVKNNYKEDGTDYTWIQGLEIKINKEKVFYITEFSIELSNSIRWLNNTTMHKSIVPPTDFYCEERIINGNFSRNTDLTLPGFYENALLQIILKSNDEIFLEFEFPEVIMTTRPELSDVFKQGHDFRVSSNGYNIIRCKGVSIL